MQTSAYARISNFLSGTVFLLGAFSTFSIMAGDALGRVNLLYLLLLFVAWPVCAMLLLFVSPLLKQRASLTLQLINLPLWPPGWQQRLLQRKHQDDWSLQVFCLAQKLALSFSLACGLALIFSLLFSDINFVWRSTLLSAGQIFPVLQSIALPWWFIEAAQPVQSLLEQTQDSRLIAPAEDTPYGAWWPFLLMAQLCYGVLPRLLSLGWGRYRLQRLNTQIQSRTDKAPDSLKNPPPQTPQLTPVTTPALPLPAYTLLYWNALPSGLQSSLYKVLGTPRHTFQGGASGSPEAEQKALTTDWPLVIVTAAWEPPMGELADLLETGKGYLLPLDWNSETNRWIAVSDHYLDEWRRFCKPLPQWQLIQTEGLL